MRPVLRCAPRRRCCLLVVLSVLLLLLTEDALGSPVRAHRSDPLDSSRGWADLYQVQDTNRYCRKCPAGTHVAKHCEKQFEPSVCSPCNKTEYTEYPNDFSKCMGCWVCREDQVELSPCQADRNTQCACRNGTFCSPDHPCEMCQKCRPQCPPGQVELAPCTQHSDRRCGPPASTSSSLSYGWIVVIVVAVVVLLVICLYVVKRFCCRSPGEDRDLGGKSWRVKVQQLIRGCRVGEGTQDNNLNEQIVQAKLLPSSATCSAQGPEETVPSPLQTLVPVPGEDPLKSLKAAFYVFYDHVYVDHWKTFGRALDLLDNDIEIILRKGYTKDSFFEMLSLWLSRQGMSASVNVLLSTLLDMRLRGTADIVSAELVQKKLFQYQVS